MANRRGKGVKFERERREWCESDVATGTGRSSLETEIKIFCLVCTNWTWKCVFLHPLAAFIPSKDLRYRVCKLISGLDPSRRGLRVFYDSRFSFQSFVYYDRKLHRYSGAITLINLTLGWGMCPFFIIFSLFLVYRNFLLVSIFIRIPTTFI